MRSRKPREDAWAKVGTTTIDGTFEQVREAFGGTWENFDHMRYAMAAGDVWSVGGRSLEIVDREQFDDAVVVSCDIVRRQSEIDAENTAAIASKACKQFIAICAAGTKPTCPECGPHGNDGRVLGLEEWYPCTTCASGKAHDPARYYESAATERVAKLNADPAFSQDCVSAMRAGQVVLADGSVATMKDGQFVATVRLDESMIDKTMTGYSIPKKMFGEAPSGLSVPGMEEVDNYLQHCALERLRFNSRRS